MEKLPKIITMPDALVNTFLKSKNPDALFLRFETDGLNLDNMYPGQAKGFYYRSNSTTDKQSYIPFSDPLFMRFAYENGYDIMDALNNHISSFYPAKEEHILLQHVVNKVLDIVFKDANSDRGKMKKLDEYLNQMFVKNG